MSRSGIVEVAAYLAVKDASENLLTDEARTAAFSQNCTINSSWGAPNSIDCTIADKSGKPVATSHSDFTEKTANVVQTKYTINTKIFDTNQNLIGTSVANLEPEFAKYTLDASTKDSKGQAVSNEHAVLKNYFGIEPIDVSRTDKDEKVVQTLTKVTNSDEFAAFSGHPRFVLDTFQSGEQRFNHAELFLSMAHPGTVTIKATSIQR